MKANRVWKWRYPIALVGLAGLAASAIAWDNGTWTLPYSGATTLSGGPIFTMNNTASNTGSVAIQGIADFGIYGTGNTVGVKGDSNTNGGYGVEGLSNLSTNSGVGIGVVGAGYGPNDYGVYGSNAFTAAFYTLSGVKYPAMPIGIYGTNGCPIGYGIYGINSSTATSYVDYQNHTQTATPTGIYGTTSSTSGYGVLGINPANSYPSGTTPGVGVYGDGYYGVYGVTSNGGSSSSPSYGVYGVGASASTSYGAGVYGTVGSNQVYGVQGVNTSTGPGVYGSTDTSSPPNTTDEAGVYGYNHDGNGYGVEGSGGAFAVYGKTTGSATGVYGEDDNSGGTGVQGSSTSGYGVWGHCATSSTTSFGGYFTNSASGGTAVETSGGLTVTSGTKNFMIDNPLAPAKKFLIHTCIESNEMANVYSGNITLGRNGTAWVTLPSYFQSLNKDYRYQLTCIGQPALVYVAKTIVDNRFQIAGGKPGMKISWQVTGVRNDAWAKAHPFRVQVDKSKEEVGRYLDPVDLGFSRTLGLDYQREQARNRRVMARRVALPHSSKQRTP